MDLRRLFVAAVVALTMVSIAGIRFAEAQESTPKMEEFDPQEWTLSVEKRLITIEEALKEMSNRYPTTGPGVNFSLPGPTRAIVVARLKDDKPLGGGVWKGRIISPDPNMGKGDGYFRHVEPGAPLVLVNLCDEAVTFTFSQNILEEGYVFTVPADGVMTVSVKPGVVITDTDDGRFFTVSSDSAFSGLPGPFILIP
jgi:hypothetical protein